MALGQFLGQYQHNIDDKGRLAIPAKFRSPLADGLVITRGVEKCLYVWDLEQWRQISDKLAKLPLMQANARRVARHFFSSATDTSLDKLGRVVIPQFLREYAGLSDEVMVVGLRGRIEIWDKAAWDAEYSDAEENGIAAYAESLADLDI